MNTRFRVILWAVLILLPGILYAHPHMWIRGQIDPEVGRNGLEAVNVVWDIDELTSAALILDYDLDRDGTLVPREVESLRRGAFEHLLDSEYYLIVEIRDMLASFGRATDFTARIEDGRLIYDFRVPMLVPIRWEDMKDVRIFLFDRTYFIDFRPEDITGTAENWRDREVVFEKTRRRSMTQGYGMIDLVGLQVSRVGG